MQLIRKTSVRAWVWREVGGMCQNRVEGHGSPGGPATTEVDGGVQVGGAWPSPRPPTLLREKEGGKGHISSVTVPALGRGSRGRRNTHLVQVPADSVHGPEPPAPEQADSRPFESTLGTWRKRFTMYFAQNRPALQKSAGTWDLQCESRSRSDTAPPQTRTWP